MSRGIPALVVMALLAGLISAPTPPAIAEPAVPTERFIVTWPDGRTPQLPAGVTQHNLGRPGVMVVEGVGVGSLVRDWAAAGAKVHPDRVNHLAADPTLEPTFAATWALKNTGQSGGTPGSDLAAPAAWDVALGEGVVVAVLDTGVDAFDANPHPDFVGRMWANPGEVRGDGIDNDGNGYVDDADGWDFVSNDGVPSDSQWHGTAVSGLVAAAANGSHTVGMAPSAKIMALKVCDPTCWDSDVIAAIYYAIDNGADIINLSLGRTANESDLTSGPLWQATEAARQAGVLIFAAAGNSALSLDSQPWVTAGIESVVALASTDHNDDLAGDSNYGRASVPFAAPGKGVLVAVPETTLAEGYGVASGTSFASPYAAGLAALLLSADPCLSTTAVVAAMTAGVDPATHGATATDGRLDAESSLAILDLSDLTPSIDANPTVGAAPLRVDFSVEDGGCGSSSWTFGDGHTGSGSIPSNVYDLPGIYTAEVEVTSGARTGSDTREVIVGRHFEDVSDTDTAVMWASAIGVTQGCTSTHFCPSATVNRGQVASFLTRALGLPASTIDHFADDDKNTHEGAINSLADAGITTGCTATSYCPDDPVTRGQMASLLARALGLPAPSTDHFTDDDGNTHENAINSLADAGVTSGCTATAYCPNDLLNRRHAVVFLYRALS